ncbi:MAG TPA: secretin N-terminal domain-containing protein [Blastocatellia bacterium]
MNSLMMIPGRLRPTIALVLVLFLVSPVSAFADKKDKSNDQGKKHFKVGLSYEQNKQWDKAAQEFTLAAAENPSDMEYTLHLQVALLNAAIMLAHRGDMLAGQNDYNAAYESYRQAYSYDPTDEVSLMKMRRMLTLQGYSLDQLPATGASAITASAAGTGARVDATTLMGSRRGHPETTTKEVAFNWVRMRYPAADITWRGSLAAAIESVAHSMRLNVVFDASANQALQGKNNYSVDLEDVTPVRALEMMLETNGLLYVQADTRTVIVAQDSSTNRQKFERQAVRTFYLKNADQKTVDDVKTALTQSIGMKQIIAYKELNALVARDTPEMLDLAEGVINSLDKSKAEVLIDVKLYQISKNDMLSLGNQFNTGDSSVPGGTPAAANLATLGGIGIQKPLLALNPPRILRGPFGIGLTIPTSTISALADHSKSKELDSAQVHVLDGEQQQIKIGQRVPIETATIPGLSGISPTGTTPATGTGTTGTTPATSPTSSPLGISGFPEIQYEDVGLVLDLTPTVYDEEIQVKLKVSSTSVSSTSSLTPTFNQRDVTSVARVRNGQTSLVAAVSQRQESKDISGIPFLSYIPVLGRLFATPNTSSTDSYVVITLTPHILRKADIVDDDRQTRDAGPESNQGKRLLTLEEILYRADHEVTPELPVANAGGVTRPVASKEGPATDAGPTGLASGIVAQPAKAVLGPDEPGVVLPVINTEPAPPPPVPQPPVQPAPQPPPNAN